MIDIDKVIVLIDQLIQQYQGNSLSALQKAVLKGSIEQPRKNYAQIAHEHNYSETYIKHIIAPGLWKLCSEILGEKINRTNCSQQLNDFLQKIDELECQTIEVESSSLTLQNTGDSSLAAIAQNKFILEIPEGQVPLDSLFYVERASLETNCYQEILQPRTFIQIASPHKTGKTSLLSRILEYAKTQNFYTVRLTLNQVESEIFTSTVKFMRWFCCNIIHQLNLKSELENYWQAELGILVSSTLILEECVLQQIDNPLVLAIDEVNQLSKYPQLIDDFFSLISYWQEKNKNNNLWLKVKLIIVYSTNIHINMNTNHSLFDLGKTIYLTPFSLRETEDLIQRHQLELVPLEIQKIQNFTGGLPYLLRLLLYHLKKRNLDLEKVISNPNTTIEIYQKHLDKQLGYLQQDDTLLTAFLKLIERANNLHLARKTVFKLHSLGLISLKENQARVSCDLYREYFSNVGPQGISVEHKVRK